jgi:hypothetical protein
MECFVCGNPARYRCSCKKASYCSKECRKHDWYRMHIATCTWNRPKRKKRVVGVELKEGKQCCMKPFTRWGAEREHALYDGDAKLSDYTKTYIASGGYGNVYSMAPITNPEEMVAVKIAKDSGEEIDFCKEHGPSKCDGHMQSDMV